MINKYSSISFNTNKKNLVITIRKSEKIVNTEEKNLSVHVSGKSQFVDTILILKTCIYRH